VEAVAESECAGETEAAYAGGDVYAVMPDVGAKRGKVRVAAAVVPVVVFVAAAGRCAYAERVELQETLSSNDHLHH
jgi:hypothetical protein